MNPLMGMMGPMRNIQGMMGQINQLKQLMRGSDPNSVMQMMAQKNPQFAQFMRENQGKTPEQIAKDYGLDWGQLQQMMK
jgi:hypothetical protein